MSPTLFRHYTVVREFLGIQPYLGTDANEVTIRAARDAAETMDQPVDIINATIERDVRDSQKNPPHPLQAHD